METIIFSVVTAVLFALTNHYHFLEAHGTDFSKKQANRNWHLTQGAIHVWVSCAVWYTVSLPAGVFFLVIYWILFEGLLNVFAKRSFFYVGETAFWDTVFHRLFKSRTSFAVMLIKLVLLASVGAWYIHDNL